MKTWYSILNVQIRPEVQEQITIGLLLVEEEKIIFDFSINKLLISKELLSESMYRLLEDSLKNIEVMLNSESDTFSNEYMTYLSRYNSNLLTFSAPKQIDLRCDQKLFDSLFNKLIDEQGKLRLV